MGRLLDHLPTVLALLVITRLLSSIHLYISRRRFRLQNNCQSAPAYPQNPFLLGLDFYFLQKRFVKLGRHLERQQSAFRETGNTFTFTLAGVRLIHTCEPANIKAVLADRFSDFDTGKRRYDSAELLLGPGVFLSDGKYWAHSRALLKPAFTKPKVDLERFDAHIDNLIQRFRKFEGNSFDAQEVFFKLSLDSVTDFLFGESTRLLLGESAENEKARKFSENFDYAQLTIIRRLQMGGLMRFHRDPKFKEACKYCRDFAQEYVDSALEAYRSGKKNGSALTPVLDELIETTTQDRIELRNQLLHLLLAGRDTTASLLSQTFFVLSRRPDIWAKLRAEVTSKYGRSKPTYEELKSLRYISWVLREVLRLYPVVHGNARVANKDTFLPTGGGPDGTSPIFVPKNMPVIFSFYSMQRREDLFGPDAAEFKPERWETIRPMWNYLPFAGGPRVCIGQQHAFTEVSYTLFRLAQEFERVEAAEERAWREKCSIVVTVHGGVKISMVAAAESSNH